MTIQTIDAEPVQGTVLRWTLPDGLLLEPARSAEPVAIPSERIVRVIFTGDSEFADSMPGISNLSRDLSDHKPATGALEAGTPGLKSRTTAARSSVLTPEPFVMLTLEQGDRLNGVLVAGSADEMTLASVSAGRISVPLEYVRELITPSAASPRWAGAVESVRRGMGREGSLRPSGDAAPAATSIDDCLLLANGDVLRGVLQCIDPALARIEQHGSELAVPFENVIAAMLAPTAPRHAASAGLRARLMLGDGGRLTATALDWHRPASSDSSSESPDAKTEFIELTVFDRRRQSVPIEQVGRIDVLGGRWTWLSTFNPISDEQTPMLNLPWPAQGDANVLGGPLRVAGRMFEHGIGVHSASHLIFDLAGEYREFATSFGIDDESGTYADVTIEIQVDGRPRFTRADVRRGALHGPVRLDIGGADRVELLVGFGANGDLQDRLDWIEPALIR